VRYSEPEEQGGPCESQTQGGTAPQAFQADQAILQNAMIWTATSDSADGPEQDLRARVNSSNSTRANNVEMFDNSKYEQWTSGEYQLTTYEDLYHEGIWRGDG
jgi:hypothetical protein